MMDLNVSNVSTSAVASVPEAIQAQADEAHKANPTTVGLLKEGKKLGAFYAYDSQLPLPVIPAVRAVKCLYQVATSGKNKGKKAQENSFVLVPTSHLTEEAVTGKIAELAPYVVAYLQGVEDLALKEYHRNGGTNYYTAGMSLDSIIERLEASSEHNRLNKESIEAWFTEEVEESLSLLFAEKLGLDESSSEAELMRLETVLAGYKAKFAGLANPKQVLKEADCKALISVIEACELVGNNYGKRFTIRLEKMIQKTDDLLLAL